ncbi:MAG: hypothetical protein WEA56_00270 [Balneolaceae bacterium]
MKEKIKLFLPWINVILVTGILISLAILAANAGGSFINRWVLGLSTMGAVPSASLLDYSVMRAIARFGGNELSSPEFLTAFLTAGTGLVLLVIIAPFLMARGYEKMEKDGGQHRGLAWYTGSCLLVLAISTSVFATVASVQLGKNINKSAAESRSSDLLRAELMGLAFDAAGLMVLPQDFGGGHGSFTNFSSEENHPRNITLNDLDSYREDSEFHFSLHDNVTDSSIIIVGISGYETEQAVEVTPHDEEIFKVMRRGSW